MTYATAQALRTALEARISTESHATGLSVDRLRRRVLFQRVVARLQQGQPTRWVVKGGMAMEVRLRDAARLTKDLDLALRADALSADAVEDLVADALSADPDGDWFAFAVGAPSRLQEDADGTATWRIAVRARLDGRPFGSIKLDISPRTHEVVETETVTLPNALEFAGIETVDIEIVDVHRHAAEKLHGMLREFDGRENTRVRDLADLMLLLDAELLVPDRLAPVVRQVWAERRSTPPATFPRLPGSWPPRYDELAALNDIQPPSFPAASERAIALWTAMFPNQEA
jgi:hypothetical protein